MSAVARLGRFVDRTISDLERSSRIDGATKPTRDVAARLTRSTDIVRDVLSGTGLGHPLHPALVLGPLGCWVGALTADLTGEPGAARKLTGAGLLLALPAGATGLADWTDTTGAEQRVGFVHLIANTTAAALYFASWRARCRNAHAAGVAFGLAGAVTAASAGWLGGHLSYAMGVGVDTNAFDGGPNEWTLVKRSASNPRTGWAAGVPLLIVERGDTVVVLADRCSHRGGPLSGGTINGDCVICPWHASRFSFHDGSVEAGPAVAPQAIYETRLVDEQLYVRRDEVRTLRLNPSRAPNP